MLITADQLAVHVFGDYVVQSDWMAKQKVNSSWPAIAHVLTYGMGFLILTTSWRALLFIVGTHFIIDRWRLARYICWVKNFLQPKFEWVRPCKCPPEVECPHPLVKTGPLALLDNKEPCITTKVRNYPWSECSGTGYHKDSPAWLSVWLMIITDNLGHILLNALALKYLT